MCETSTWKILECDLPLGAIKPPSDVLPYFPYGMITELDILQYIFEWSCPQHVLKRETHFNL